MAISNYYVDPAINANSGTGTLGDPFGDLQYGLNNVTRNATDGDRFNIKAGTAEVMAAAISLATYGTPAQAAPLTFQGYTSAQGDGGIGEINNGGANVAVIDSTTLGYINFIDMKLGNTGTAQIVKLAANCVFVNVEFHSSSANNAIQCWNARLIFERCYFHDITGSPVIYLTGSCFALDCRFVYAVSGYCVQAASSSVVSNCTIYLTHAGAFAIRLLTVFNTAINNSIHQNAAGTAAGISVETGIAVIKNNIITGFSGAGGDGIRDAGGDCLLQGANAFYNNTTNEDTSQAIYYRPANLTLSSSPFVDPANGNFTLTAAAAAELASLGWPTTFPGGVAQYLDPGAVQIQPAAAGNAWLFGGLVH